MAVKNKNTKAKEIEKLSPSAGAPKGDLLPPLKRREKDIPTMLEMAHVKEEMSFVYKQIWLGKMLATDATKIIYILDKIAVAIRSHAEIEMLQANYNEAWTGLTIIHAKTGGKK